MPSTTFISEARIAWKLLNGIVCLYKPVHQGLRSSLQSKLCEDLNSMKCRKPERIVEVRRILGHGDEVNSKLVKTTPSDRELVSAGKDGPDTIQILEGPNLSDHPLVVGPRYQKQDIKMYNLTRHGEDTSGLSIFGVNKGVFTAMKIHHMRWLRGYVVSGRFGTATDNQFHTGKIIEKSTYHRIKKTMLDRMLDSTQAAYQRGMFETTALGLRTELAYDLASKALLRPAEASGPVIYGVKCSKLELPDFELEIHIINESENFLKAFIQDVGLRLNSTAHCTKLRCVKYGPFTIENALLKKHWDIKNVIANMDYTASVLKNFDMDRRDPLIDEDSADMKPVQNPSGRQMQN